MCIHTINCETMIRVNPRPAPALGLLSIFHHCMDILKFIHFYYMHKSLGFTNTIYTSRFRYSRSICVTYHITLWREATVQTSLWSHPFDGHRSFFVLDPVIITLIQCSCQPEISHLYLATIVHPAKNNTKQSTTNTCKIAQLGLPLPQMYKLVQLKVYHSPFSFDCNIQAVFLIH